VIRRPPKHLLGSAVSLALDVVTADVVGAMNTAGVRTILLKGPALAQWLYEDGAPRPYLDIDLLVAPGDAGRAEAVLIGLGFHTADASARHATVWMRAADGASIDLHTNLIGIGRPAREAWTALEAGTDRMRVGGREVEVLGRAARALHVGLHAAEHGMQAGKALNDLGRALERTPPDVWEGAAALADRLDAASAFATGLRLVPSGRDLADRLDLTRTRSIETALRARTAPAPALGLHRLATTSGLPRKVALVAAELFPPAPFMRGSSALARKGTVGLAFAYVWRPLWLVWRLGPALVAWRRAHNESRQPERREADG
jgi:hypothetical protein